MGHCFCCGNALKSTRRAEEMIAMVSHDLRAPLTSIQFALELLTAEIEDNSSESALEELAAAKRNANRLIKMINSLLGTEQVRNRQWSISRQRIRLSTIVDRALDALLPIARNKNIEIRVSLTEFESLGHGHRLIDADADRLLQVVTNLISNAIKFSPVYGVITVSARQVGKNVELTIEDNGPGVPPDARVAIFEPYVQAADAEKKSAGVGLGLAICKEIVEQHGGTIGVRPRELGGSTFWFCIPVNARIKSYAPTHAQLHAQSHGAAHVHTPAVVGNLVQFPAMHQDILNPGAVNA